VPILWRYLLKHYFQVFFLCITTFILILLVSRIQEIAKLAALNSTFKPILLFTLCQIPYILPIAIPLSGLIAAILLFQKLSSTHELTALRTAGLNIKQISTPLLMSAFFLSLINFFIVCEVTPKCRLYSRELLYSAATINPLFLMKKSKLLKLQDSYVEMNMTKLGKKAKDVIFVVKNESNDRLTLMSAKKLEVEDNALMGENVSLISHHNENDLIIENQRLMSTGANTLTQLMQNPNWKIGFEHLPLRKLLNPASKKPKALIQARFELFRRFYFPLMTFAFTLMGISLGMQIGREKRKKGVFVSIGLATLTLICYITAKSFLLSPIKSALFIFLPLPLILLISLWFQKRIARGIE